MPRFRGRSRLHVAPEALRRAIPDAALPRSGELRLGPQQVRETEQQREPLAVLLKTPVADLRVPEVPLHVEKRMLSLRTHRGLPPLRLCLSAPGSSCRLRPGRIATCQRTPDPACSGRFSAPW